MEVGADGSTDAAALEAVLAVVPEPGDDPPERLGARLEEGPPAVVLEAASVRRPAPGSSQSSRMSPIMRRSPARVESGRRPAPGSSAPERSR